MSAAREAVARAIQLEAPGRCPTHMAQHIADAALAALRPFIAAEIRAWADLGLSAPLPPSDYQRGVAVVLNGLKSESDAIADRITTTGEA